MLPIVGLLLAACGGGGGDDDAVPASGPREVEVGRVELKLVDTSRKTPADDHRHLAEQPSRTLPTVVLYPTGKGPFPLVVFAHGHSRDAHEYEGLLRSWVQHGYVVAAPNFPLSTGAEATPDDTMSYADVVSQPGDLSFVIGELPKHHELTGRIDPAHVAAVGHSLGGITVLRMRNDTCCTDTRVDAAVAIAGVPLGEGTQVTANATPLLLIHSAKDPTVPVSGSEGVFAKAAPPLAFLRFAAGGHDEVFDGGGAAQALTHRAILAFLDARLRGDDAAWAHLPTAVEQSRLATLTTRN
jgi:dienelactone hydrolase